MSVAVAFAGQGAETPRMGVAMAEAFPAARALLDAAGPAVIEALHRGRPLAAEALQPALVAVQLGAFEALRAAGVAPKAVLGHSLGELAAWAASGAIDGVSAVRLAQVRGAAMAQAAAAHPGGMVALATGSLDAVGEALAAGRAVGVLSIAAHNAPREWVLSGDEAAVRAAVRACGGRRLDVAGPWHAPTMASARAPFARALAEVEVRPARVTFVANATGEVAAPDAIPALLERQLVRPVRWARAMRTLARLGVTDLVIAGPGKPLRHLARGTGLGVHACEDPADVARIAEALR
ncbi:MAG: ACP S-malonyltransferase [Sandaracinaceae bacterium]